MTNSSQVENYQAFMDRCEIYFPHDSCIKIGIVYKLAKFEHRAEVRKDEFNEDGSNVRYFEHLRRVALLLIEEVLIIDEAVVIEALLHDSIEDTRLTREEISFVCGPEITQGVLLMSKKPKQGFMDRLKTHASWRELAVKCADRIDNLRHMENSPKEFVRKQLTETSEYYFNLSNILVDKAPLAFKKRCTVFEKLIRESWNEAEKLVLR